MLKTESLFLKVISMISSLIMKNIKRNMNSHDSFIHTLFYEYNLVFRYGQTTCKFFRGIKFLHKHDFDHCTLLIYLILPNHFPLSIQCCNEEGQIFVYLSDYFFKFLEVKLLSCKVLDT